MMNKHTNKKRRNNVKKGTGFGEKVISESNTTLRDKMWLLHFKLKMLETWIFEKKLKQTPDEDLKNLEQKQHNFKHEYNRICKLLGNKA